ncbi:ChaN family lipoprotein [Oceanobacter mangrovi]|uniref:ChaN family lipoprotein n=1 Tax=Oceanobacter mangrovi TaxID=2862510 RepID=UPI001C8DAF07|nr:ChaN family lipoprotein [Oceanobacter mangrovi]
MLETRRPVNYQEMLPRNIEVAIFGEVSHNTNIYKIEFLKALPELKRRGFTHLGMEMFPANLQSELNKFSNTASGSKELAEFLEENWSWGNGSNSVLYFKIIEKARSLGIKIIGLDLPYDQHQQYDTCNSKQLSDGTCKQSSHLARNIFMTDLIANITNHGGRCIAFMHYYHAVYISDFEAGIKNLLDNRHIQNKVIKLLHPEFYQDSQPVCGLKSDKDAPTIVAAYDEFASNESFYIKGYLSSWNRGEDYIVFLPCQ